MRLFRHTMRSLGSSLVVSAILVAAHPQSARAQTRLLNAWVASSGAVFENWSLPTAIATTGIGGGTSMITGASQLTIPAAVVVPVADGWTVDAYSAYVRGEVRLAVPDANGRRRYLLEGPTDTRLRLVGQLMGESLLLSVGVTAPTGRTGLSSQELNALNVIAAPALRFRSPFLGAGAGGTIGLIFSRPVAGWGLALGTSYEARGTYAPAEAIGAGATSTDLRPGNATHLSLAAERLIGSTRQLISVAGDLNQEGELRSQAGGAVQSSLALGPSVSGTYQLDAAFGSWPITFFAVGRHRAEYRLGGEPLAGTSRTEAESGLLALRNFNSSVSLRIGLEGRVQSTGTVGAPSDGTSEATREVGFATAGVKAGGGTLALRFGGAGARLALEPFGRVQVGRMDFGSTTRTLTGISGGATFTARF